MADIWLSGYKRVPLGSAVRGKPYQFTHNPKGCLHTTEGSSIAGARAAYAPYPPHLIYDWRTRQGEQHVPLNLAAYSAMDGNDDDYMVQVELVGFAAETRNWPEQALRNIAADVIAPIEAAFGVPRRALAFKDGRDGIVLASPNSPIRLSAAGLRDYSGWLGHQHLPAPDHHWDPGAIPINKIFSFVSQEDDVTPAELWAFPINIPVFDENGTKVGTKEVMAGDLMMYYDLNINELREKVGALMEGGIPAKVEMSDEDRASIVADLAQLVPSKEDIAAAVVAEFKKAGN